jgi:4a-hydroxytetrahydrobiopterin dehydratase
MKKLTEFEIEKKLENFPDWDYYENALHSEFEFDSFKNCMSAMMRIAFECEILHHHPEWKNVYNILEIKLTTHDAGGVTELDFKLAEAMKKIVEIEE